MENESINQSVSNSPRKGLFMKRRTTMGNTDIYINSKRMAVDIDESPEGLQKLFNLYFKKARRTIHDAQVIQTYLSRMNEFMEMLRKVEDAPISELLQTISLHMTYEFIESNRLLFKTGDTGNKFYIILKGRVDILGAQPVKLAMNELEYITYLGGLKLYGETELLQKTVQANRMIYPFESDDFDKFLRRTTKLGIVKDDPEVMKFKNTLTRSSLNVLLSKQIQKIAITIINSAYQQVLEKVTVEEYIERLAPKVDNLDQAPKYMVTVFEYTHKLSLTTGGKFGDTALNDALSKRSATIITYDDTHFGVVYKELYDICIKSVFEKVRMANITVLNSCEAFRSIPSISFSKKYYANFVSHKVLRGDKLLEEGYECKCYYFIKDGEFEVSTNRSLAELTGIIKSLGGSINDHDERHLCLSNPLFNKHYNEKSKLRVFIIKPVDALGFDDYVINGLIHFTTELISAKGEVFRIDKNIFNNISHAESTVMYNSKRYVNMKKIYLVKRLLKMRETKMGSIMNRISQKKENTNDKFLLRPNTALLVPKKLQGEGSPKKKGYYPKKGLFFKELYEQRLLMRSIERPDEDIENTLIKVDQVLNSARDTDRTPSMRYKTTKRTMSALDRPIRPLNLEDCRCSSVKSLVRKDLGEMKENEKRMYFIRQKYNLRRRNKSDSSLNGISRNSNGATLNETPRVTPYQFANNEENEPDAQPKEYLNKINLLFHNRAKIFKNQFLTRDSLKKKPRKTQSATTLARK
jgi:CRP-like cAMP-binding protein